MTGYQQHGRRRARIAAAIGFAALSTSVFALGPASVVGAQQPPPEFKAEIVNTADNPVPIDGTVAFDGTQNVNVANTPDVNIANTPGVNVANTPDVNVANTANVNVANTPGVNVANTPDVKVANTPDVVVANTPGVEVRNSPTVRSEQSGAWSVGISPSSNTVRLDPATPVAVDVSGAPQRPVQAQLSGNDPFTVPQGHRFVIEFVSIVTGITPVSDDAFYVPLLRVSSNGTSETFFFPADVQEFSNQAGEFRIYTAAQQTRLYADPGASISGGTGFCGGGCPDVRTTLSGYLVPLD